MKQILFIFLIFIPYIKTEYISLPDNGWCVNFYENHQQISWPEAKIFCKSNEINNTDLAIIPVGEINKEFQNMSSTKFSNDSYWWANAFGIFDEISGYGHWDDILTNIQIHVLPFLYRLAYGIRFNAMKLLISYVFIFQIPLEIARTQSILQQSHQFPHQRQAQPFIQLNVTQVLYF
uniref:C-type lectin domain-containing protein n=1 Tax=Acrobeloides nanus TaxID=290746 RepID=A0A914DUK7_9BILA